MSISKIKQMNKNKEKKLTKRQIYKIFEYWFYNFISDDGCEPSPSYEDEAMKSFRKRVKEFEKHPY